jgi:hypothetical protein
MRPGGGASGGAPRSMRASDESLEPMRSTAGTRYRVTDQLFVWLLAIPSIRR